jgi:hypothetical protein
MTELKSHVFSTNAWISHATSNNHAPPDSLTATLNAVILVIGFANLGSTDDMFIVGGIRELHPGGIATDQTGESGGDLTDWRRRASIAEHY